jgi:hypothetical protein
VGVGEAGGKTGGVGLGKKTDKVIKSKKRNIRRS